MHHDPDSRTLGRRRQSRGALKDEDLENGPPVISHAPDPAVFERLQALLAAFNAEVEGPTGGRHPLTSFPAGYTVAHPKRGEGRTMSRRTTRSLSIPVLSFAVALALSIGLGPANVVYGRRLPQSTSCQWQTVKICVRQIQPDPAGGPGGSTTVIDDAFLAGLKAKLDAIYATCCINFELSKGEVLKIPANQFSKKGKLNVYDANNSQYTPPGNAAWAAATDQCLSLYYVADVNIHGGKNPVGVAQIGQNGMIMDDGASGETVAHEVGHNLGLGDLGKNAQNLMSGVIDQSGKPGSTALTPAQCKTAYEQARTYNTQGYK